MRVRVSNQERMNVSNIGRVPPPPNLGITMDKELSLTNNDETISTLVCVRGYSRQYSG